MPSTVTRIVAVGSSTAPVSGGVGSSVTRTPTPTTGAGGQLDITAGTLQLDGGAEVSASAESEGPAGSVFLVADTISLEGTVDDEGIPVVSTISASGARGAAGIVDVETDYLVLKNGGQISTSTIGVADACD